MGWRARGGKEDFSLTNNRTWGREPEGRVLYEQKRKLREKKKKKISGAREDPVRGKQGGESGKRKSGKGRGGE